MREQALAAVVRAGTAGAPGKTRHPRESSDVHVVGKEGRFFGALVAYTRPYQRSGVISALERAGCTTVEQPCRRDTSLLLRKLKPSLVVLVVDPTFQADLSVIRAASQISGAMVLVITSGVRGQATALNAGADACLREEDGIEVICGQIAALARRSRMADASVERDSTCTVGDLSLDFDRFEATRDNVPLALTPIEFNVLAVLAQSAGKVLSAVEILRQVHHEEFDDFDAREAVKVYIQRIRAKVEPDPRRPSYITNVRGFGYIIDRCATDSTSGLADDDPPTPYKFEGCTHDRDSESRVRSSRPEAKLNGAPGTPKATRTKERSAR